MRNNTKVQKDEVSDLANDARALMVATANVAGHKVERARKRLEMALQRGKSNGENLIDSTADLADETIKELRNRITAALEHGREIYDDVHDDVVGKARAADTTVRENPYQVMGIALGVGAIVGFLMSYRNSHNSRK